MAGIRTFETGATRDTDEGKPDYDGFLSPIVLARYAKYMNTHRLQSDGNLRPSDNWQSGIPIAEYMKSMWRHFMDLWTMQRGWSSFLSVETVKLGRQEALCALLFNVMGMLHEIIIKDQRDDDAREALKES